jgi:hypothetical protein
VAADRERAMSAGSPALVGLVLALGGAVVGRTLAGRMVLVRIIRRRGHRDPD